MDVSERRTNITAITNIAITLLLVALLGLNIFLKEYVNSLFIFLFISIAIFRITKAPVGLIQHMPGLVVFLLMSAFWSYRGYGKYKVVNEIATWQQKFGWAYNITRAKNGTPIIPAGWQPKYREEGSVSWRREIDSLGHNEKYITFNGHRGIFSEFDHYDLKTEKVMRRYVEIITQYGKAGKSDSVLFRYYVGEDMQQITRKDADSLFYAEKVQKDY